MLWFSEKVNHVHVENKKRNNSYCRFYIIVRSFKDFMFGSRGTWTLILTAFEKEKGITLYSLYEFCFPSIY